MRVTVEENVIIPNVPEANLAALQVCMHAVHAAAALPGLPVLVSLPPCVFNPCAASMHCHHPIWHANTH